MKQRVRRNHSPAFKAKVALAALKGDKTLAGLAQQFDIHVNQITQWKSHLRQGAAGLFGSETANGAIESAVDIKLLHAKIGALSHRIAGQGPSRTAMAGLLRAKRGSAGLPLSEPENFS